MDRRRRMMQERKAKAKRQQAGQAEKDDRMAQIAAIAQQRRERMNKRGPPLLGKPRVVVEDKEFKYFWPEAVTPIPEDIPHRECQRRYGCEYQYMAPMDPLRAELKSDLDLHRMSEEQLLETFRMDIGLLNAQFRTRLLTETVNIRNKRRLQQKQSKWKGEPARDEKDVIQQLNDIVIDCMGKVGHTLTDVSVLKGAAHAVVALDRSRKDEYLRTITCFRPLEDMILDRVVNPTMAEERSMADDGKTYKKHRIDLSNVVIPDYMIEAIEGIAHLSYREAKTIASGGPVSILAGFLQYGGYVSQTAAAAVIANCAKVMEITESLCKETVSLLVPMIGSDVPELRQLAATVAVHMFSTWSMNRHLVAKHDGLMTLGETLTDRIGGTCAMVHERATLAILALCEAEDIRRKAFRVGVTELLHDNLLHGLTPAAVETACYGVTFLIMLHDRQILRACTTGVMSMLRSRHRVCKVAALRCLTFMTFSEEEKTNFAQAGMVHEVAMLLHSPHFELIAHIFRALLAMARRQNVPDMILETGILPRIERFLTNKNRTVKDLSCQLLLKLDQLDCIERHAAIDPYIQERYGDMIQLRRAELAAQHNMLGRFEKPFPKEELRDIREKFVFFDDDNSGTVDRHELQEVLETLGYKVSKGKCRELIAKVCIGDKNSELEWSDFIRLVHDLKYEPSTFKRFKDGITWLLSPD